MSCIFLNEKNIKSHSDFLSSFDYVLTDCDGVLWLENQVILGAPEVLQLMRKCGKKIFFVTNNSTKSTEEYLTKFESLKIEAHVSEIFSTSYCAALYLKSLDFNKKVYLIGTNGIGEELKKCGIEYLPIGPDPYSLDVRKQVENNEFLNPEVGAVIVGFDEHISYTKIMKAASYLKDPKCIFVGTNTDEQFPIENKSVIVPGTGVMVSAVATASCREPFIIGKPETYIFDCIKKLNPDIKPERCLMIGDRLNTDILFGHNIGSRTLLTMSGVTAMEEVEHFQNNPSVSTDKLLPDFIVSSIGDLIQILKNI